VRSIAVAVAKKQAFPASSDSAVPALETVNHVKKMEYFHKLRRDTI
jgi:primosomal protein N'